MNDRGHDFDLSLFVIAEDAGFNMGNYRTLNNMSLIQYEMKVDYRKV